MVQGPGMALKRAVPIRLGGMPGMPGFRGQAQIGELQGIHHLDLLVQKGQVARGLEIGVHEGQNQGQGATADENEEDGRFSQSRYPEGCDFGLIQSLDHRRGDLE